MRKGVSNFWRYAEVAHGANSRLIAKLRGHGLIAKVTNSRLYRVSKA